MDTKIIDTVIIQCTHLPIVMELQTYSSRTEDVPYESTKSFQDTSHTTSSKGIQFCVVTLV